MLLVLSADIVAILITMLRAYRLHGEWSAVVMIIDAVVLGYASLKAAVGVGLHRWLRRGDASRLLHLSLAVWSILGPVLLSLYSVLHWIQVLA